ncbi:hypothetical protein Enr10x_03160 [Gimesia panareensis]|uniref:Uncharacterized protein n=1 Tax=Gimesia panareensis TaxID=2527978 RepID=A0A517Q073_9PLAN|nr:hypothetical protein [Gimesia panareensis]QDT25022.1 hypothetical protein Enr10x_03160 [Gimesia panareensis]
MRRHPLIACGLTLLIFSSVYSVSAEQQNPVNSILTQWAAASRFLSPLTPQSAVEQFKQQNQAYFTGHELALISEFQQQVSFEKLNTEYQWQVVSRSQNSIILKGQPRDVLTRRLCRPFELQINPRSMLPESLKFQTRLARQNNRFASIELTALKEKQITQVPASNTPNLVKQTVAKAIFPEVQPTQQGQGPIKRVSFSRYSAEDRNPAELQQIEKLVARWVTESTRIESVRLGNGITIFKRGQQQPALILPPSYRNSDRTTEKEKQAYLEVLPGWLIDVDQKSFQIESFTIEFDAEETESASPQFVTLKLKPHPDAPRPDWESVELEFSSRQPLPVRISETRKNHIAEFLLSDIQIHYKK